MADRIMSAFSSQFKELEIPLHGVRLPSFEIDIKYKRALGVSEDISNEDFLEALCEDSRKKMWSSVRKEHKAEYAQRLEHELKTIKDEDYKELKEAPKHEHFIQLQIYLNLTDKDYGVVMYENKNDQNLKAFKVDRDKKVWEDILDRCKKIMTMTTEPEDCTGMWYCKCKNRRT